MTHRQTASDPQRAGMLLLRKPKGITSFKALADCKRVFGTTRIGHSGTLDKFAQGLLLVFVAQATKLVSYFVGLDKTYRACIRFGTETDTLDPEGRIVATGRIPTVEEVTSILSDFAGEQEQVPPAFSAVHIDGKRAYERVLSGETPDMKPRRIRISQISMLSVSGSDINIEVTCSSGTYIRSLARDIARALNTCAHLCELERVNVNGFSVTDAIQITDNAERLKEDKAYFAGRKLAECIPAVGILSLSESAIPQFAQGKVITDDFFTSELRPNNSGNKVWAVVSDYMLYGIVTKNDVEGYSYLNVFPQGI